MLKGSTKKSLHEDFGYMVHQSKVYNARPIINSFHQYAIGRHLSTKSKKEQLAEERYTEIEKANRILLEKMSLIFQEKASNKMQDNYRRSLNIKRRRHEMERIMYENNVHLPPGHIA
jgi:hypothetical protein